MVMVMVIHPQIPHMTYFPYNNDDDKDNHNKDNHNANDCNIDNH